MKTYQEHYNICKTKNPILGGKYNSIYDLTVDRNILDEILRVIDNPEFKNAQQERERSQAKAQIKK